MCMGGGSGAEGGEGSGGAGSSLTARPIRVREGEVLDADVAAVVCRTTQTQHCVLRNCANDSE